MKKEMRLASGSDVERLKEIWKLCFGDPDAFIDFYFSRRFKAEQAGVYLLDGLITAMLTMIPIRLSEDYEDQKPLNACMFYAIATHPEYRHRGIATELMNWAASYLRENGVEICVLVPAEVNLFGFYEKQGYQEGFALREVVLSKEEIAAFPDIVNYRVFPIEPQIYNTIRHRLLKGSAHIVYEEAEIAYQKSVSQLSGTDLFEIKVCGEQGCAAVEVLSNDKVLVKELLFPEELITHGLKALASTIKVQEFIVRTPADRGKELGGQSRPFGMVKRTDRISEKMAYLGLAFD